LHQFTSPIGPVQLLLGDARPQYAEEGPTVMGTRSRFWVAALGAAIVLCLSPCRAAGLPGTPVLGTFVGAIPGTEALIAIHSGTCGSREQEVVVYVCDGKPLGLSLWFDGIGGNDVTSSLSRNREGALTLHLTPTQATGTLTLRDGRTRSFTAAPSVRGAGIYLLTIFPDHSFAGDAFRGPERITGHRFLSGGVAVAQGQICLGDGTRMLFSGGLRIPGMPEDYRAILGSDGRLLGTNYPPFVGSAALVGYDNFVNIPLVRSTPM
jgi:hypothetical protein